jgi:drug/metabolite transporter (DMT)-like permease
MLLAAALALASAFCFAVCTVMQHAETRRVDSSGTRLLVRLLRRPIFLISVGVEGIAILLQALATGSGTVAVVQPLLVTGLVFAVILSAAVQHRRVSTREVGGAAVCVAGLMLFLLSSRPAAGVASLAPGHRALAAASVIGIAVAAAAVARLRPSARGASLALCGGVLLGQGGVLLKVTMHLLEADGVRGVLTWQFVALLATGITGTIAAQNAFQAGSLPSTLAILTVTEPLTAIVLGASLLHEHLGRSPADIVAYVVALLLSVAGVLLVSSRTAAANEATSGPQPDRAHQGDVSQVAP